MRWAPSRTGWSWPEALLLLLTGCAGPAASDSGAEGTVPLTWYRGDASERWEDARIGLDWALSQLGATPPASGEAIAVRESTPEVVTFTLDPDALALPPAARAVVDDAAAELADHPGSGGDDVGRFLLRTLHEPWRYYAATGACPTLDAWRARHQLEAPEVYAVTTSLLVDGDRLVELPPAVPDVAHVAFAAYEGAGSLADGTFAPAEAEVVDVLPSGQYRYAVYDADGQLEPAARTTAAGTPGKCAWCHEASLQPGTSANASAPGYVDYTAWIAVHDAAQAQVDTLRVGLDTAVRYDQPSAHEAGERLVEGFLLPDAARVAAEWGTDEAAVVAALGDGAETLPELGWTGRYLRAAVDEAAPEPGAIATLPSVRELAGDEPLAAAEAPACE